MLIQSYLVFNNVQNIIIDIIYSLLMERFIWNFLNVTTFSERSEKSNIQKQHSHNVCKMVKWKITLMFA